MAAKKVHRVTNPTKLTVTEAAEAHRLRSLVAQDKDEIIAEGRRLLAEKRQGAAAAHGVATLGQKILAAREAHGLTQAELPIRAHVAQAYLSYLEQDQRDPVCQSPRASLGNWRSRSTSWRGLLHNRLRVVIASERKATVNLERPGRPRARPGSRPGEGGRGREVCTNCSSATP
jgi:DNA-binding transcriptional regulator YiaG